MRNFQSKHEINETLKRLESLQKDFNKSLEWIREWEMRKGKI